MPAKSQWLIVCWLLAQRVAKVISVFIAVGLQSLCASLVSKKRAEVQKEIVLNDCIIGLVNFFRYLAF